VERSTQSLITSVRLEHTALIPAMGELTFPAEAHWQSLPAQATRNAQRLATQDSCMRCCTIADRTREPMSFATSYWPRTHHLNKRQPTSRQLA
jgi:hypothetical protein